MSRPERYIPSTQPPRIARERVERAAKMYKTSTYAGQALGITASSFLRLCKRYGIDPPRKGR